MSFTLYGIIGYIVIFFVYNLRVEYNVIFKCLK